MEKKKFKVLVEGIYRTWIDVDAETAFDALMNTDFVIPSDLKVSISDIEDFTPVEVVESDKWRE